MRKVRKVILFLMLVCLGVGAVKINRLQECVDRQQSQLQQLQVPDLEKLRKCTVLVMALDGGHGSGVVISPDGLILTAGHVVDAEPDSVMFIDGTVYKVQKTQRDLVFDVGFIWIDAEELDCVTFSTKSGTLGDIVYHCGTPWDIDFKFTVTKGVISALDRDLYIWKNVFQMDCASWPGCSGGPVINVAGNLMGILVGGWDGDENLCVCEPLSNIISALER